MIISGFNPRVSTSQLKSILDIYAIFKRRGRDVIAYEEEEKLLFNNKPPSIWAREDQYYHALKSGAFRRVVSCVADSEISLSTDDIREAYSDLTLTQVKDYLSQAVDLGFMAKDGKKYTRTKPTGFGSTFEWYIAEVCKRELASVAYWGVTVKGMEGDYDVVLVRENQIGYIECKSGKLQNITEEHVRNFLDRERALSPHFSIFLADGVSRERLQKLVDYALSTSSDYAFETPGIMSTEIALAKEDYKNFVRLVPINSFFVSTGNSIQKVFQEIYRFLTTVTDRGLPMENKAAKRHFE